ncbi:uncharacterized protein [Macrobrachium rosenbergii]|uniref:uncharacterized protein n=1 Tax=Macrobrachium rosenbergii TaxID=79674 RepID=UPI0034D6D7B4
MAELERVDSFSADDIKIEKEFVECDKISVSDKKDPDSVEEYTSTVNQPELNATSNSEEYTSKVNQPELNSTSNSEEYTSKMNQFELNAASNGDSSVISEEKSAPVFKKRKRLPKEDRDEERGKDDETDREKRLSVCTDEEEQKDLDEISLLLSIRDSVQKVAQTQNEIGDLIVDFVKKRRSLQF